jgi:hypothetical protein
MGVREGRVIGLSGFGWWGVDVRPELFLQGFSDWMFHSGSPPCQDRVGEPTHSSESTCQPSYSMGATTAEVECVVTQEILWRVYLDMCGFRLDVYVHKRE